MNYWEVDPEGTVADHWIDFVDAEMGDPESRWCSASVKWDGCIHFNKFYNSPMSCKEDHKDGKDMDYIHICDVDDFIKRLTELRDKAKEHFVKARGSWPG